MGLLWMMPACTGPVQELSFFAAGNCAACQALIESSLTEQSGIHAANWDFESSQVKVSYDPRKWDADRLQETVAAAGFNTGFFDADPTAQGQLPACCREQITRELKGSDPHGGGPASH